MPPGVYPRKLRLCTMKGCARKHVARGYCGMHFQRWRLGKPVNQDRHTMYISISSADGIWREWRRNGAHVHLHVTKDHRTNTERRTWFVVFGRSCREIDRCEVVADCLRTAPLSQAVPMRIRKAVR